MSKRKKTIAVALSGGVDSAVVATMLKDEDGISWVSIFSFLSHQERGRRK